MDEDITPCVPDVPGIDLNAYKAKLIERFSNPAIADQVQRLAEDGSTKLPNGMIQCAREQLARGGSIKFIALALAGWIRYLSGVDEDMNAIEIKDGNAAKLKEIVKMDPKDPIHVLSIREIFGDDMATAQPFVAEVRKALTSLYEKGTKETLTEYLK
jgi:mannitol 2-dehydrogenase